MSKEMKAQEVVTREAILDRTHYGVQIYAHVLRKYYKDKVVLVLRGKSCLPANNPFNRNRLTLQVSIVEGEARHRDEEVEACKGDAFDFAALHYKMEGKELLERLNEEMHLGIGKEKLYCNSAKGVGRDKQKERCGSDIHALYGINGTNEKPVKGSDQNFPHFPHFPQMRKTEGNGKVGAEGNDQLVINNKQVAKENEFSFFKKPVRNTIPSGSLGLVDVYKKIKGTAYRKQTNALRAIQDTQEARAYKAEQFDYVTFSGTFVKRENSALVQHSGLFAVDLDHLEDVEGLKQRLFEDPYFETVLLFVSPSGDGLKWIIPIDLSKATHHQYAIAISNYLLHHYKQKMDASGKDVARACFLPHDPNIYINPKYL